MFLLTHYNTSQQSNSTYDHIASAHTCHTNLFYLWERKYRGILYRRERLIFLQILIQQANEEFHVSPRIHCHFDGKFLRTYQDDSLVEFVEARIGDTFFLHQKHNYPVLEKDTTQSRGKRIARHLGFASEKQFEISEDLFEKHILLLKQDSTLSNIHIDFEKGSFGFVIADKVKKSDRPQAKGKAPKIQISSPIFAWISDDISSEALGKLLDSYSKLRTLYCTREFIFAQ